jgi:hypothetical protein
MNRAITVVLSFAFLAMIPIGCQTMQAPPPEVVAPTPVSITPPPERKPARAGDYLIYPLKWRNAEDVAFELYLLLYPKYGPALQIIPDPDNNQLLIYLPPKSVRWQNQLDA